MGACYLFKCSECGYTAEVSGGKDRGMSASVQTMICKDCTALVDVYMGRYDQDHETGDAKFISEQGNCPKCFGKNLDAWNNKMSCPKCKATMEKGDMTILWD